MTAYTSAVISEDGLYRYELIRRWGTGPLLEWIMLNPSTADGTHDDATIRRCIAFAKAWGYAGIVVHNLYAYRATKPDVLAQVADPIGPENADYLSNRIGAMTVVAWGANPAVVGWFNGYPYDITKSIKRSALYCLGVTASGQPRHPLYIKSSQAPISWKVPA